jgi:DNA helicase II / ATP-dependent DNA helicase PcrA
MKTLRARYASVCQDCGDDIEVGDVIGWEPGRVVCADCNDAPSWEPARGQQHAATATATRPPVSIATQQDVAAPTERIWSDRQQAVFAAALDPNGGNLIVNAVAGSGKTTSIIEAVNRLRSAYPSTNVTMVAFNADIAKELQARIPRGATAGTFHAAWKWALEQKLGRRYTKPDANKVRGIGQRLLAGGAINPRDADRYLTGAVQLVAKAKGAGIGVVVPDELPQWQALLARFPDIDFDGPEEPGILIAQHLLKLNNEDLSSIDFDDMLYLSALFGAQCERRDWVIVDEAQDFNAIQRYLLHRMLKPSGRLIAVGDRFQSVYGFRGADFDAIDRIRDEFGCRELPLDISYRCPRAVVKLAQSVVPHIQPSPAAPEGAVVDEGSDWKLNIFQPTDVVLCRNTAPLVTLAYRCLAARVPCRVLGRDISSGLTSLITRMKARSIDELLPRLETYRAAETKRLLARMQEERVQALEDKIASIHIAISNLTGERTIDGLIGEIEALFSDNPNGVLTLSTVHRAKGKEWPRVFLLNAHLMPSRYARTAEQLQQEQNVIYVAYTRAQASLHFITVDEQTAE